MRQALELEAAALVELDRRKREFPLFWFKPVPKLVPFHLSRRPLRLLAGGNRCGKSEAGMAEAAAYMLGYRPWILRERGLPMPEKPWERPASLPADALCWNCGGCRVPVPNTIFIVTGQSAGKGIRETLWPKLQKLLGPFIIDHKMSHAGTPAEFTIKNGSRAVFGSDEQRSKAFESTNYTATFIDEPIRRTSYQGIKRGSIDQLAPITMTFTPIGLRARWAFRDIYCPGLRDDQDEIHVSNISMFDNPYLSPEAIEHFAKDPSMTEVEREARLYGRFRNLVDRVYPNFNDEVHVIPSFTPPPEWLHGLVIDPHSVRPWFVAYFVVSPRGEIIFHKEWPPGDFTKIRRDVHSYEWYLELFRRLEGDRPVDYRLIDPNFGPRKDINRETGARVEAITTWFGDRGLWFDYKLNDDLLYGEARVRQLLAYDEAHPVSAVNRPKLYFTEDVPNCIASMSFYCPKTKADSDDEVIEDERDPMYKDGADVVRYVAVSKIAEHAINDTWRGGDYDDPVYAKNYEGYEPNE